jgi:hypothetical protein
MATQRLRIPFALVTEVLDILSITNARGKTRGSKTPGGFRYPYTDTRWGGLGPDTKCHWGKDLNYVSMEHGTGNCNCLCVLRL